MEYGKKKAGLLESGIALWDVVESCERKGSADTTLKSPVPNDFAGLLGKHPGIKLVVFNGKKAHVLWSRLVKLPLPAGVRAVVLPSTSANHRMPLKDKIAAWAVIRDHVERAEGRG